MISLLVSVSALMSGILLHPVHETYCEMQWNTETRCVEVALRLHSLDEQWIEREFKKEYSTKSSKKPLETGGKAASWQSRFLRDFLVFDAGSKVQENAVTIDPSLHWVGRKQEGAHAWWFFEVKRKDGQKPRTVRTRLLFQRHGDYRHRVVILDHDGNAKSEAIVLHREQSDSPIDL